MRSLHAAMRFILGKARDIDRLLVVHLLPASTSSDDMLCRSANNYAISLALACNFIAISDSLYVNLEKGVQLYAQTSQGFEGTDKKKMKLISSTVNLFG